MKRAWILLFISSVAFSHTGSGTSGGGDADGLEISATLNAVVFKMEKLGTDFVSVSKLSEIKKIQGLIQILVVDGNLPVQVGAMTQNGVAFSTWDGIKGVMHVRRSGWRDLHNVSERERLLAHELFVMSGDEKTGSYSLSIKYDELVKNHWRTLEYDKNICTISVFDRKVDFAGYAYPGKSLGTYAVSQLGTGAQGFGAVSPAILYRLEKRRAWVAYGHIDSIGYFKMGVYEVELDRKGYPDRRGAKEILSPKVYFSPYPEKVPAPNRPQVMDVGSQIITVGCALSVRN